MVPIEVAILAAFYFIGTSSCPDCRNAKRTCYYCQLVICLHFAGYRKLLK